MIFLASVAFQYTIGDRYCFVHHKWCWSKVSSVLSIVTNLTILVLSLACHVLQYLFFPSCLSLVIIILVRLWPSLERTSFIFMIESEWLNKRRWLFRFNSTILHSDCLVDLRDERYKTYFPTSILVYIFFFFFKLGFMGFSKAPSSNEV